jgi:hypothetical protein
MTEGLGWMMKAWVDGLQGLLNIFGSGGFLIRKMGIFLAQVFLLLNPVDCIAATGSPDIDAPDHLTLTTKEKAPLSV